MDSYQLGKDIQSLHDKLDQIMTPKKCGCSGKQTSTRPGAGAGDVTMSRTTLLEFINQFHKLAMVAQGTGGYSWADFVKEFGVEIGGKFCCICHDDVGGISCFTIDALSIADANVSCLAQQSSSCGVSVKKGKCGSTC